MTSRDPKKSKSPVQPGLIPHEAGRNAVSSNGRKHRLNSGLFITFEGGEGTGKTTQATRLASRIADLGIDVKIAREPGGTEVGEKIRSLVKGESNIGAAAETLLFAAARAQLVSEVIGPGLRRRSVVIVDRYVDSAIAYQGYGRGMDVDQIEVINRTATGGVLPELTVLLDADPAVTLARVDTTPSLLDEPDDGKAARAGDNVKERRFEQEPLSFHEKVRKGYRELAREGKRWCVVGADQAQHRVADAIWKRVRPLLIERGVDGSLLKRKQGVHAE